MRILLVEDDYIIAFDLAEQLKDAGFQIVGPALSNRDAIALLSAQPCDAAILDVNLGSETSEPVAQVLVDRQIPFLTVSGYSSEQHPAVFRAAKLLMKPIRLSRLIEELRLLGPAPVVERP
ncbi:MAG: response regulator [Hyphomicrobiales bacterium]|nr:MAG: response regulator [Hyphomicrobiales bacterium]